jgi:hypothetical protein
MGKGGPTKQRPESNQQSSIWQFGRIGHGLSGSIRQTNTSQPYARFGPHVGSAKPLKMLGFARRVCTCLHKAIRRLSFCHQLCIVLISAGSISRSPAWSKIVSITYFPMAKDAVAAGEGTLQTCSTPFA